MSIKTWQERQAATGIGSIEARDDEIDELRAYGAAEYKRGIEDAAKVCDDMNNYQCHSSKRPTPGQCGWAIRQLGEQA